MSPIRILLANHQPIVRSGLRLLLERDEDLRVVAEAANGREAMVLTDFTHPDVVLLEVPLPLLNGIAVAREISRKDSRVKAIFVTAYTDEGYVIEAFKAGATGYVASDFAPADLARAIRAVARGRPFLSSAISTRFLEGKAAGRDLSEYQKQLYCSLAEGYEEDEIAARLDSEVSKIRSDCRTINSTLLTIGLPDVITTFVSATGGAEGNKQV